MKVLLLGGTGAMGMSLAPILAARGDAVYITSRSRHEDDGNIHYFCGDAHNDGFLQGILKEKFDVIVDFMIYGSDEFKDKVKHLLDATGQYIFTSSGRVYADSENPITESSPRLIDVCKDPEYLKTDEYALAKAREENELFKRKEKNWTVIRPYITYNVERLQLGAAEKDLWLYRAIHGRTIPLPKDVAECKTTMTYGGNVAEAIAQLIGNNKSFGEVFNLTGTDHMTWAEVLTVYLAVLEKELEKKPEIFMPENSIELSKAMGNGPQVYYDRLYHRVFDNSKLMQVIGKKILFTPMKDGLEECLRKFMQNPKWLYAPVVKAEAFINSKTSEVMPLNEVNGIKPKLRYIEYRYFPVQKIKTILGR